MPLRSFPGSRELGVFILLTSVGVGLSCGGGDVTGPADDPLGDVAVASVEVTPSTLNLSVGQSSELSATPRAEDGAVLSGRTITWASGDEAIATVDQTGKVTAVAPGEAEVSASSEGKRGDAAVTVSVVPVATVEVVPDPSSISVGQSGQLTAIPKAAGGEELLGRPVTWATSDPTIATVSGTGLVTGVAVGDVTITATSEGKSGTSLLTVSAVPVATVEVAPHADTLDQGASVQLTATAKDANSSVLPGRPATWSTSNSSVARVTATGKVTGVGPGSATITATIEGKTGTASIRVEARPVATVDLTPASATVVVGRTLQLTASVKDANGNVLQGRAVTWTTSAAGVATVSESGLVRGVAAGSATITATSEGKSGTATVTVSPPTGTIRTWKSGASGNATDWSTAANWDPRGEPIPLDTVRVPAVANAAVLSEDVQIARLILAGGTVRNAGYRLQVNAP